MATTKKYEIGQIRSGFQKPEINTHIIKKESNSSNKQVFGTQNGEEFIPAIVSNWYKLGIQAPPGSRWELNENKEILIGRTGMYELDDDIIINSIKYIDGPFVDVIIDYLEGASN